MVPAGVLVLALVRVRIARLVQVAEGMVDLPVFRLICSDIEQQVLHLVLVFWHLPVMDGDFWCLQLGPFGELAIFDFLDGAGVGDDGLFLQVPDKAVTDAWGDQVGDEEAVEEYALGAQDHQTHEPARFRQFQESK